MTTLTPRLRKFALATHVICSVGWLGAVVVFLALAIVGLTSQDDRTVRGLYLVMEPAAWFVLVPFAITSLVTGIVMSLGTTWGLFRHYWVLFKLLITIFATIILLMYMRTFRNMSNMAADSTIDLWMVRNPSPVVHSVLALLVLIVATVLAVNKPQGITRYGRRKQHEQSDHGVGPVGRWSNSTSGWVYVFGLISIVLVLFAILHLTGGGHNGH